MDSKMIMMKIISMFPAYRYPPKDPPSVGWMRSQGRGLEGVRESHRGVSIHIFGQTKRQKRQKGQKGKKIKRQKTKSQKGKIK